MLMLFPLVLSLALAPAPSDLSPEAAEYNAKAMRFYDAGQFALAVDEFQAAYRSMPDARRDLAGREQLLGSMRATLLALHAETRDAAPLCRLKDLLQGHIDALTAAYPEDPNKLETRSARARQREVTEQLAPFGPDACKPPPPVPAPVVAPVELAAPSLAPPGPPAPPLDNPAPRRLQIAGGIMAPLGLVALGLVGAAVSRYRRDLARADDLHAELADRPCTENDRTLMRELLAATRRDEGLMIALGLTGGALLSAGTALLVRGGLQRRRQARLGLNLRQNLVGITVSGQF
jgi:hypothetical protein